MARYSNIGIGAPHVESGQVIWRDDSLELDRFVKISGLHANLFLRSRRGRPSDWVRGRPTLPLTTVAVQPD